MAADSRGGVTAVHQSTSFDSLRRVSVGALLDSSYTADVGLDPAVLQTCKWSRSIDSGLVADSDCVVRCGGGLTELDAVRTFGQSSGPLSQLSATTSILVSRTGSESCSLSGKGRTLSANGTVIGSCDSGLPLREDDNDDDASVRSEEIVDLVPDRLAPHRASFERRSKASSAANKVRSPEDQYGCFDICSADRSEQVDCGEDDCCGIVHISEPSTSSSLSEATSHLTIVASESSSLLSSAGGKSGQSSWLLRLFESKLFDMPIAIQYLFNSKELGVQTYIG